MSGCDPLKRTRHQYSACTSMSQHHICTQTQKNRSSINVLPPWRVCVTAHDGVTGVVSILGRDGARVTSPSDGCWGRRWPGCAPLEGRPGEQVRGLLPCDRNCHV